MATLRCPCHLLGFLQLRAAYSCAGAEGVASQSDPGLESGGRLWWEDLSPIRTPVSWQEHRGRKVSESVSYREASEVKGAAADRMEPIQCTQSCLKELAQVLLEVWQVQNMHSRLEMLRRIAIES